MTPSDLNTSRDKYFDWCAGRISERLSALSADEVAILLEEELQSNRDLTLYAQIGDHRSRTLISAIHLRLALPSFDEWLAEYSRDPGRLERDLLFRRENV
jgi:hypothetical protein